MADPENLGQGRVAIVTGGARGIGRGEAILLARHGFRVVVNDYGADVDGANRRSEPAEAVVEEINAFDGEAIANAEDISDWAGSKRMIEQALDTWGQLDVLVCNAGILRDRVIVNLTEDDWDSVVKVHLKGTFAPLHHAAVYWREQAKGGKPVDARVITTTSGAGLGGHAGQGNYAAAKAGIAGLTLTAAQELDRYGVRVNCISPIAYSRMTENTGSGARARELIAAGKFNDRDAENVAPAVVWLASDAAKEVTGRVLTVYGGTVALTEPWHEGPKAEKAERWTTAELDGVIPGLLAQGRPQRFVPKFPS